MINEERKATCRIPDQFPDRQCPDPQLCLQCRMIHYIEEHYALDITLSDIAESACLSESSCCRIFRKYIHTTPLGFVNQYRLYSARVALCRSNQSIMEIAAECGFNYESYFAKKFEEQFGCTPWNFRHMVWQKQMNRLVLILPDKKGCVQ